MVLGLIRPAREVVTGVLRGEADGRAADRDGEGFGVVALAEGDAETADGEGVEDFVVGDADGWVSWALVTAVAAAPAAPGCGPDWFVMIRQTARPTAISAAAVPVIRLCLRLRCRAA